MDDFGGCEEGGTRGEGHARGGHAVGAAEVAALGYGDAEVGVVAVVGVG